MDCALMRNRDRVRLSEIVPIFENILTHRNSECDAFVAGRLGRCEKKFAAQSACASRTGGRGAVGAAWRHVMMDSGAFPLKSEYPVAIVGAGPVGITTALALSYYAIPFVVFEATAGLWTETKAGTTLIRTLEIWHRFGAAARILSKAMRVDEIGDIERATNRKRDAVKLHLLR